MCPFILNTDRLYAQSGGSTSLWLSIISSRDIVTLHLSAAGG